MNAFEKYIYEILKHHPSLKLSIRNFYLDVMDLLPDLPMRFEGELTVRENHFFGFHDHSPFSDKDEYILSNKLEIPVRMPLIDDPLTIGFWNSSLSNFNMTGTSYAWNYHKGCRLQWLGLNSSMYIYNTAINNKLVSVIGDINNKTETVVDFPIDSVSPNGSIASSFSYERLNNFMPGYGYLYEDEGLIEEKTPSRTGLFIIDLKSNKRQLICPINNLANYLPTTTMKNASHFVTHSMFSPDNRQIAFLHRWVHDDIFKRYSRLVICDLSDGTLQVLPSDEMVSHYVWDKDNGILAYCRVNDIDGHYLFPNHDFNSPEGIAINILNSDGHQHFIPNSSLFITDTYPDRRRHSKLFLVDMVLQEAKQIASIKSLRKFQTRNPLKHWACDLHPRVSNSGKIICFDSVHTGNRALCFLNNFR